MYKNIISLTAIDSNMTLPSDAGIYCSLVYLMTVCQLHKYYSIE